MFSPRDITAPVQAIEPAKCRQCHGKGFIGGGTPFAYQALGVAPAQCDLCHGSRHEGRNSPAPRAETHAEWLMARENAARDWADDHMHLHRQNHGQWNAKDHPDY